MWKTRLPRRSRHEWIEQQITAIESAVSNGLQGLEDAVKSAEGAVMRANSTLGVNKTAVREAFNYLKKAKSYLSFLKADGSRGVHAPRYVLSLISESLSYARKAERTANDAILSLTPPLTQRVEVTKTMEKTSTSYVNVTLIATKTKLKIETYSLQER